MKKLLVGGLDLKTLALGLDVLDVISQRIELMTVKCQESIQLLALFDGLVKCFTKVSDLFVLLLDMSQPPSRLGAANFPPNIRREVVNSLTFS